MSLPSIQPSVPAFTPDPATRRDPRRETAPQRQAFTLPEPVRDAPGMARRPEPTRALPAHDNDRLTRGRGPDGRPVDKPDQPDAARRDASQKTTRASDKPTSSGISARGDKPRDRDLPAATDEALAGDIPNREIAASDTSGDNSVDASGETDTVSAETIGAATTGSPDAEKAASETFGLAVVAVAAEPMTAHVDVDIAGGGAVANSSDAADAASVVMDAGLETSQDMAATLTQAAAGQPGTLAPHDATADAVAVAFTAPSSVAGAVAGAAQTGALPTVQPSANPAAAQDNTSPISAASVHGGGLPSPPSEMAAAGQGSADGRGQDGEHTSASGPDAAQKSAEGQGPRLDAPKTDMPKPEFLQRLEQTLAGLEGRAGQRLPDAASAPASDQRPTADMVRPTHPSAVPMEIGLRALQGAKEFQIRLDPAELGRIDVRLEIGDDKSVSARLVVDRVETLQLLQRDAKTLERALEQAGLKANDAGIDISLRDPGQQGRPDRGPREDDIPGPFGRNRGERADSMDAPQPILRARGLRVGGLDLSI